MGSSKSKGAKEPTQQVKHFAFKEMVKKSAVKDPTTHYQFLEKIGEGSYSEVFKVQSRCTGQFRVIKKVLRNSSPTLGRHLLNQFDILREMDHPNIIKMYEMFEDEAYHYIVTEYLPGKDALELLVSQKSIDEKTAFSIVYQCLLALNYLHLKKVMHRDVKLENVIFDEETSCFKLIDFGSSLKFTSSAPQERRSTGTIHYIAPEVINRYYNMKCDVWSLGVLLFILLSGNAPFTGETHQEIIDKTMKENLAFDKPIWKSRSKQAKDMISRMLEKNFEKRPSVSQLLRDPWIVSFKATQKIHKAEVESICFCLERLAKYTKVQLTSIQSGILLFMIHFIIKLDNQIALIRSFNKIDQLGDGVIDQLELKNAFINYLAFDNKKAEITASLIMQKVDLNGSKDIAFSEFVMGAVDLRKVITHQNLSQTFRYIDTDGSQKIEMDELQARLGDHLDASQYQRLVGLFDSNNDGQIDFYEFSQMMTDLLKQY